ncbi:MAG: ABC transporter substrate-binding protein [Gammaproteobacteria bacterium]|nr:ABC transporter substrate-binding protein [Gammaproteobacteria bacterium]
MLRKRIKYPMALKLFGLAVSWMVLISVLHYWQNFDNETRKTIRMGYMPVITNMAAPILDHVSKESDGIRFKAIKFSSFAEMAESLRNGQIEAGFMIAPLAIVLRQQGEDIKVVYIGNRHESTLVARKGLDVRSIHDLSGKTVAVPMRFSGHNLSMLKLIEENGLEGQIKVVEMNPPDMASALSAGSLDAYYVGEPFAAQTLKSGDAELVHYVEEVWDQFICNLVVVRQDLIDEDMESVKQIVEGAVRSGMWAKTNPDEAAIIASNYWNQPLDLVKYAMNTPDNRILFDKYVPKEDEMQDMADLMQHFNLINDSDIEGLVDSQFALNTDINDVKGLVDILR